MSNCSVQLIGRPVIPPYWSLGFQLSRWDYGSLAEVKNTVERNRAVDLPYVRSCLLAFLSFSVNFFRLYISSVSDNLFVFKPI